jgi:hypothetical protein
MERLGILFLAEVMPLGARVHDDLGIEFPKVLGCKGIGHRSAL